MQHLVQGGDQALVGVLQGLDVHHGTLGLLGRLHRGHLQHVGVGAEQLVGHIRHLPLGLHGLLGVVDAQVQHHLALPQGNGVDQRGLNLLGHERVVVLEHADLGTHLQGHHPGQLQVVELLLKAVDEVGIVVGRLGVLGLAALLGLAAQLGQGAVLLFSQLLPARQNIHGQLLIVFQILVVHLVQHGDVLHQGDLVLLQRLGDPVHVGLGLAVLELHLLHGVVGPLEQTGKALLLLRRVDALQLRHQVRQHVADLAHVLGADGVQGAFGEVGDVLLGRRAVLQHLLGVADINLLGKALDRLLLRRRQDAQVGTGGGGRLLHQGGFLLHLGLHFLQIRRQGQLGNLFFHEVHSFSKSFWPVRPWLAIMRSMT